MATPANLLLCKLCKKTTKRRMDEHISDRHPIIEIGSNKFQLISKNVTKEYLFISSSALYKYCLTINL